LQQPIPDAVATTLRGWQQKAACLPLERYMEFMREDFCRYSAVEPSAPVELLVQWANTSCGQSAAAMLLWLGELFAEAHPGGTPDELKTRTENALCRDHYQHIWPGAFSIGRELWPGLSKKQIIRRLISQLSDYVACQLWGGRWLRLKNYPQTARTKPYAHERRNQDAMERWEGTDPKEVILAAQLERILDDVLSQAKSSYPNHPLAHAVKLEQPKEPVQGNVPFLMLFSLLPLIQHQRWCTADVLRCLLLLRPDLQNQFDLEHPEKRAAGCKYINRQLLKPIGLGSLDVRGRPVSGNRPPAFEAARIVIGFLREMLL
jgi:hypothetical protein